MRIHRTDSVGVEEHENGFRVTDVANNTVRVSGESWTSGVEAPSVTEALATVDTGPAEPATTLGVETEELSFPPVYAVATPVDRVAPTEFGGDARRRELPPDDYLLRVEASVRLFLRVQGAPTLRRENAEGLWVSFPEPTRVGIAVDSHVDPPGETVVVPETPGGVATALSTLHGAVETTTPDRTWPTKRNRPPSIRFGAETHVPETVDDGRESTEVVYHAPPSLDALVPAASLIHYLGASVKVAEGVEPALELPERWVSLSDHAADGAVDTAASALLRRCFYLDCVARGAGPHGGPLSVADTFDTLGLDPVELYETPLAARVRRYLDVDFDAVTDRFPEWHLSVAVEPTYEHAAVLPHLVSELPFLPEPDARDLAKKEWMALSLTGGSDGGLRGERTGPNESPTPGAGGREVSNVDLVDPNEGPGRTHGWLAEGVPVGAYKALPAAYANRDQYLDEPDDALSVTAVVNDTEMMSRLLRPDGPGLHDERQASVAHYARREEALNVDVTVEENLSAPELAQVFGSRNDLVHFLGHHDEEGLDCAGGYLHPDSVDKSRTETFFLNACGSYPFGQALVRKGSVVGGVTFESVLDDDAFEVGSTFAGLMTLGYTVSRALAIASQKSIAPKDYAVVGDGTHRVMQSDALVPPEMQVFETEGGEYEIVRKAVDTGMLGGEQQTSFDTGDESLRLVGQTKVFSVDTGGLLEMLRTQNSPARFDGELLWPDKLTQRIE
ncbi:hypothetical protein [Halobaculum sp. MBLA0143]|uniref:hypothetical protein n=1 Tax=Halobaculum sp. MBLA0143 TaxID=3079933 RepID=UPI003523ED79